MLSNNESVLLDEFPAIEQGCVIQVSDTVSGIKYISRFFGIEGKVLVTRLPAVSQLKKSGMGTDELTYRDTFTKKRKLVMRMISHGRVYAFETEVVDLFLLGGRLLMSTYPKKIQSRMLRKEPRYPCAIPSELVIGEVTISGIMINFSTSGGLLKLTKEQDPELLQQARSEQQECILKLQLPFDEQPSEVHCRVMSLSVPDQQSGLAFTADRDVILRYITALKLESISDHF
ncbi:PilZ domain-containing protein [uncultured Amphritea sp.]|uniref:PilZ domain-containing protein n=1 Tax=uncultured Amphritea sp. TaxID=981605 RepID=UPI002609094E|nr:PilZ domain-containing protein [uncultured Amphritea sp.]